ncbi:MAG TPA: CCA tRNA nucleotidyltransferase [Longimicrobiales bacterium]
MELNPPRAVREIARRLEDAGYETWAVGGAVRDAVLGLPADDWDLASRARPQEVRRLFRRTVPIGIEHGTVGVLGGDGVLYEVTTFRRDVETFGRHATVEFADTVEEDLSRRDFTCNALAWHPLTGELRDPYTGLEDLRAGRLRTVGEPAERFAEDYLRVLRALRFAGHFELAIDPATWAALTAATPFLPKLSAERIREELWKIFTKTQRASRALSLYAASGALAVLFPELDRTVGVAPAERERERFPGRGSAGPERSGGVDGRAGGAEVRPGDPPDAGALSDAGRSLDAWTRSLLAVDALPTTRPLLRMTALLHAVGMPAARTRDLRGGWRYTGHEVLGGRLAGEIMRRLKASNAETARVARLVARQSELFPPDAPGAGIRRWLRDIGPDLVYDLFRLRFALWRAEGGGARPTDLVDRWRAAHRVRLEHPVLDVAGLAVDGADLKALGLEPGPQFGEILRALVEVVIDRPELNTREALLERVRREVAE